MAPTTPKHPPLKPCPICGALVGWCGSGCTNRYPQPEMRRVEGGDGWYVWQTGSQEK